MKRISKLKFDNKHKGNKNINITQQNIERNEMPGPKNQQTFKLKKNKRALNKGGSVDLSECKKAIALKNMEVEKNLMTDKAKIDEENKDFSFQKPVATNCFEDLNKMIEEAQEREERMHKQIEVIQTRAKLALKKCKSPEKIDKEEKSVEKKILNCERQLTSFKSTMDDILHVTKETQNEIQKTKDMVAVIQNDTTQNRIYGSFHSKFVEDEDEEIFKDGIGRLSLEMDNRPGFQSQQSQAISSIDDDCLSNNKLAFNIKVEYVITNEDGIEGTNDVECDNPNISQLR